MPYQKMTQALVDSLPYQDTGTLWVHNTELDGLSLSIGQRTKTYCAAGERANRFIRVKIGRADVTKANEAHAVARAAVREMQGAVGRIRRDRWAPVPHACDARGRHPQSAGNPPVSGPRAGGVPAVMPARRAVPAARTAERRAIFTFAP